MTPNKSIAFHMTFLLGGVKRVNGPSDRYQSYVLPAQPEPASRGMPADGASSGRHRGDVAGRHTKALQVRISPAFRTRGMLNIARCLAALCIALSVRRGSLLRFGSNAAGRSNITY